ncbi:MAG: hypothetical protein KC493_03720 [Bacteriovoracaceae bacterium]|nr:hypothetical protein [Bacteriovoracaceae bacterium]
MLPDNTVVISLLIMVAFAMGACSTGQMVTVKSKVKAQSFQEISEYRSSK